MTEIPHSCTDNGHVWIEGDGSLYVRHRDRQGVVDVSCLYCEDTASLVAFGKATAPFRQEQVSALASLMKDTALRDQRQALMATMQATLAPAKIQ